MSPAQQRHSSTSAMTPRPSSATASQQPIMSPMAPATLRSSAAPSMNPPMSTAIGIESPVMSETLSVIDEHMNDMGTPRSSFANGNKRSSLGSTSIYSSQPLHRASYIAGQETDEEENHLHTEDEVMVWSAEQVAEYLEDHGVERAHCEVFKEQEITGEVLLAMEQSSLFIKEFELGPVGRRLRTWHKIKALQDETRQSAASNLAMTRTATSEYSAGGGSHPDVDPHSSSVPRALDPSNRQSSSGGSPNRSTLSGQSQAAAGASAATRQSSAGMSPLQTMTSISRGENTYRPSAQVIRQMQGSRRHSSIDSTSNSIDTTYRQGHRKQPSFDSTWQPGQPQLNGRAAHAHTMSSESNFPKRESNFVTSSPVELDRGYFSSNEADSRPNGHHRNVLTKKPASSAASPAHSRTGSQNGFGRRSTQPSRMGSSEALREAASGVTSSPSTRFGGLRSLTSPQPQVKPMQNAQDSSSPIVTRLDGSGANTGNVTTISASPNTPASGDSGSKSKFFGGHRLKITGMRTISDAVTKSEKTSQSPSKEDQVASPASFGSTTPSTESRSLDVEKSEAQSRTSQGSGANLVPPPTTQRRPRAKTKTKKSTSAYTRGLVKLSPAEQMIDCDYSGWMKKKSGSLMTTWKSRLFVLKGRRLSYYYADTDTEEKGLIDISFHRVLPAHNETLTGIHAAMTGAGAPTSPNQSTTPTLAQNDLLQNPPKAGEQDEGLFIFKLVPPKSGLAKGVSFTKPTVHYFAVNSRQEGRLWMAALMKATIDRDDDGVVTTTYNQKTISLAKARARKERPPALREDGDAPASPAELAAADDDEKKGLGIDTAPPDGSAALTGADRDPEKAVEGDESSIVPSTTAATETTDRGELDDLEPGEREAIAHLAHA